jgi:hypothetical protein
VSKLARLVILSGAKDLLFYAACAYVLCASAFGFPTSDDPITRSRDRPLIRDGSDSVGALPHGSLRTLRFELVLFLGTLHSAPNQVTRPDRTWIRDVVTVTQLHDGNRFNDPYSRRFRQMPDDILR